MKPVQLHIPMHIPTIGEQCIDRMQERIDAEKTVPDGNVVRTKMIYIKKLIKP